MIEIVTVVKNGKIYKDIFNRDEPEFFVSGIDTTQYEVSVYPGYSQGDKIAILELTSSNGKKHYKIGNGHNFKVQKTHLRSF